MFAIDRTTGWVTVNKDLDHDRVALFQTVVEAEDISAPDGQTQIGTGTFYMKIISSSITQLKVYYIFGKYCFCL